jgi:hypothetical protein
MNEEAASAIIEYINERLSVALTSWPKQQFVRRAYSRWAAYELAMLVMDHPLTYPEEVIEDFIFRMECLFRVSEGQKQRYIFSVASDTAEEILTFIRTGKEQYD